MPEPAVSNEMGTYAIVPLWVLNALVRSERAEALSLYVGLHNWTSGRNRSCYPSRKTIAEYIGVSVKTVTRYTQALEDIGALEVHPRYSDDDERVRSSNSYVLRVTPRPDADDQTPPVAGDQTPPVTEVPGSNTQFEADPSEPVPPSISTVGSVGASPSPDGGSLFPASVIEQSNDDGIDPVQATFDQFYEQYPRKVGKRDALKAWKAMTWEEREASLNTIREHVWMWRQEGRGTRVVPYPATWLRAGSWEDETGYVPETAPEGSQGNTRAGRSRSAIQRMMQGELES